MTEPQTDLIGRLQLEAQTWEGTGPNGLDYLGELLHEAAAELTACRAEQARLQEDMETMAADGYDLVERVTKAEAQVTILTAALRRATDALGWFVNSDRAKRPFSDFARAKEIMNGCDAVLRAASEGA